MQKEEVIQQIKKIVKEADDSATAILYGSRASGNAKPDSDWDVLILLKKPFVSIKDEQMFRHKLYELELNIGESISTFVYSQKDWNEKLSQTPLYKSVQQNGVIL